MERRAGASLHFSAASYGIAAPNRLVVLLAALVLAIAGVELRAAAAIVRAEQALYAGGPLWRIELASPVWPRAPTR